MFVRLKTGVYAGEIREVRFAHARVMLDDGRAELPEVAAAAAPAGLSEAVPADGGILVKTDTSPAPAGKRKKR